jgi:predicted nucleotide-binding protein (sugar kinase/HSP70/actin superfamily)
MIGHNRRPDYGSHPILELEAELKQTNDEAQIRYAQSRFNLIRENHRHSADLVAELQQFFAELDRDTTETWQKLSQRRKTVRKQHDRSNPIQQALWLRR